MKKLFALLLAVLLVLALAACAGEPEDTTPSTEPSQSTDAPADPTVPSGPEPVIPEVTYPNDKFSPEVCADLIGAWKTPVVLDGTLMNMPEFTGRVSFDLLFTFQDSGRYTISADENTVLAAIIEYEDLLTHYMLDGFYAKFAAESKLQGKTEAEIEEDWANGRLQAAEAQVEAFVAGVGLTTRFASAITHGDYYVQNQTLFLSDGGNTYEAYTFLIRNGLLYFVSCSEPAKYMNLWLEFPLPLWKDTMNYEDHPAEDLSVSIGPEHPTVTVPVITEPTDPLPTVPPGFIAIPTSTGGNYIPTRPAVTEPVTPTVTQPDAAVPTEPAVTEPPATKPVETEPPATKPVVTDPPATKPTATKPTEPAVTDPPATKPVETEPPATKPTATKPAVTEPSEPVVTFPLPTEPEVTVPPTTKPAATEPTVTEPSATEAPTEETLPTEPAVTEPPATEPPLTDPDIPVTYPTDPDDGPIDTNVDWVVH